MNLEINQKYSFFGKVENCNQGDTWANINLILEDGQRQNVKLEPSFLDSFSLNKVYYFNTVCKIREDKLYLWVIDAKNVFEAVAGLNELDNVLKNFYEYAPLSPEELKNRINGYISEITNPTISLLLKAIYTKNEQEFYLFPAATKFHHAFLSGLAYHTYTMLKMAKPFLDVYPILNRDLLYAGIILHDMGKISELSEALGAEYTLRGHLIGHMVLESNEIEKEASRLGISDCEEVLLLNHMVISSHGNPLFGAAKKPMLPEALLLWYLDTIDSKFSVITSEFENTNDCEFTSPIAVLEKGKMYKHNLNKKP